MADHFYGANLGHGADPGGSGAAAGVLTGTSTTSAKIELRIEDGVSGITNNKVAVALAIDAIKAKVLEGTIA